MKPFSSDSPGAAPAGSAHTERAAASVQTTVVEAKAASGHDPRDEQRLDLQLLVLCVGWWR